MAYLRSLHFPRRPRMRRAVAARSPAWPVALLLLLVLLLAGCAHRAPPASPDPLLADHLFPPSRAAAAAADVFALNDAMRHYADTALAATATRRDPRRALIEALYGERALRYDASRTRSAAEAFDARAGNCLSLVIMTAAFARHLGLPVSFQQVMVDDLYTREGNLTVASGHVNLVLSKLRFRSLNGRNDGDDLTVDFLPQAERRGQQTRPLAEKTIVAMFMNNRAAEALTDGRLADAYAWSREAVHQDPGFAPAANTLGVIYQRAGHLREAEAVLRHVLRHDPRNIAALSNLARLLRQLGRDDEAQPFATRLAALQPTPPFHHYALGRAALEEGRWADARDHLRRELRLQPLQHEVHHAMAVVLWRLGEPAAALRHLRLALEYGTTAAQQGRYAAKLQHLRAAIPSSARPQ